MRVRTHLHSLLIVLAWIGAALGQGVGNSPYPTYGADSRHTNRSAFAGPVGQPDIAWIYEHQVTSSYPAVEQPPSIGEDGTIYIGVRGSDNASRGLTAINPDGTYKWTFATGNGMSGTPAIDDSGHAYINIGASGGRNGLAKVDLTTNSEVWFLNTEDPAYFSSPVIAANGNVLFGAYDTRVRSVNPSGAVDWAYFNNRIPFCSPAIDDSGTIYFAGGDAGPWPDGGFATALHPDGSVKWIRSLPDSWYGARFGPNVLDNGNIVFSGINGTLSTFDAQGTLLWEISLGGTNAGKTGALSLDGSILYVKSGTSQPDAPQATLYAIDVTNGSTAWSHPYEGNTSLDAPMVGADGTIYTSGPNGSVMAFDPAGSVLWTADIAQAIPYTYDYLWSVWPIIGSGNTIYVVVRAESLPFGDQKLMVACLTGTQIEFLSPECGSTVHVEPGETVEFAVTAEDEPERTVTLDASGLPPGAIMDPALPISGNPVSSDFSWTTDDSDNNTGHIVEFMATNDAGLHARCRIGIEVGDYTLVTLVSFTAIPGDGQVTLQWTTASEIDNAGFYLLRSTVAARRTVRLHKGLIPARGDVFTGADYTYVDETVVNGVEYEYTLVDIDLYGTETRHPPVRAIPNPPDPPVKLLSPVALGGVVNNETHAFRVRGAVREVDQGRVTPSEKPL